MGLWRGRAQSQARTEGGVASAAPSASCAVRTGVCGRRPINEATPAKARIAELERLIGRQQADLHFFREALRLWDATSRSGGAPASMRSSKR